MLPWFKDLINVTEKFQFRDPTFRPLLPNAFVRGDLNAATRSPFILISFFFFSDKVYIGVRK